MLRRVAVVRTDILEERITSNVSVTRICELGTTLAFASNRSTLRFCTLMMVVIRSSERFSCN
jgi:hypothetical protein